MCSHFKVKKTRKRIQKKSQQHVVCEMALFCYAEKSILLTICRSKECCGGFWYVITCICNLKVLSQTAAHVKIPWWFTIFHHGSTKTQRDTEVCAMSLSAIVTIFSSKLFFSKLTFDELRLIFRFIQRIAQVKHNHVNLIYIVSGGEKFSFPESGDALFIAFQ